MLCQRLDSGCAPCSVDRMAPAILDMLVCLSVCLSLPIALHRSRHHTHEAGFAHAPPQQHHVRCDREFDKLLLSSSSSSLSSLLELSEPPPRVEGSKAEQRERGDSSACKDVQVVRSADRRPLQGARDRWWWSCCCQLVLPWSWRCLLVSNLPVKNGPTPNSDLWKIGMCQ